MIRHIRKDGTEVPGIDGVVIRAEDFPQIYRIADRIGRRQQSEKRGADRMRDRADRVTGSHAECET